MTTVKIPMCEEELAYLLQLLSGLSQGNPEAVPAPHHTLLVKLAVVSRRLRNAEKS